MDFIWIIIGIIYIVYKFAKEDKNYAPLSGIVFFFIISLVTAGLLEIGVPSILIALLYLLSPVIITAIAFLFYKPHKKEIHHDEEIRTLQEQFRQFGHPVKRELLETLYENHFSPLYHKVPTVYSCYEWLCKQQTNKFIVLSTEELCAYIGISLTKIPLNKERSLDEAYLQRKLTLLEYILNQQGLQYHDISNDYTIQMRRKYLSSSEYLKEVVAIIKNNKTATL